MLFDEASGANFSHFYDPDILARLHEAATLTGEARTATYAQLNLDIMALSPLAVLLNDLFYEPFSACIGCRQISSP